MSNRSSYVRCTFTHIQPKKHINFYSIVEVVHYRAPKLPGTKALSVGNSKK